MTASSTPDRICNLCRPSQHYRSAAAKVLHDRLWHVSTGGPSNAAASSSSLSSSRLPNGRSSSTLKFEQGASPPRLVWLKARPCLMNDELTDCAPFIAESVQPDSRALPGECCPPVKTTKLDAGVAVTGSELSKPSARTFSARRRLGAPPLNRLLCVNPIRCRGRLRMPRLSRRPPVYLIRCAERAPLIVGLCG